MSLPRPLDANNPDSELGGPSLAGHGLRLDENLFPTNATQVLQEGHELDGSKALFTMYLDLAEEEDKKMAESWKVDADGKLVFTGLLSAAVAAMLHPRCSVTITTDIITRWRTMLVTTHWSYSTNETDLLTDENPRRQASRLFLESSSDR